MRITLPVIAATLALTLAACGAEPGNESTPPRPSDTTPPSTIPETPPTDPTTPATDPEYDWAAAGADLEAARELWATQPQSYRFTYVPSCFCDQHEITVEVIDGRLVDPADSSRPRTVDGWFDEIEAAIGTAYNVRATYGDTGAPTSVYIDVDDAIADEEYGYELVSIEPVPDALETFLDDEYGCGYGFAIANARQTVSMVVSFDDFDFETGPQPGTYDLADMIGSVRFGTDLMSNWCDDVIEEGEPEVITDETWDIAGGTLELTVDGHLATGTLVDVVALGPDAQEHHLGNVDITNGSWGFFAG